MTPSLETLLRQFDSLSARISKVLSDESARSTRTGKAKPGAKKREVA